MSKTAYIMMGTSGSGKSSWIRENIPGATVCSADLFFMAGDEYKFDPSKLGEAHQSCLLDFMTSCRMNITTVVCDNTNTTIVEVAPYIAVAQAYGYEVKVIVCDAPPELCADRNAHGMKLSHIERMSRRMFHMLCEDWPPFWPVPQYTTTFD